ncbi:uncharacterized protein ARMOST_16647 [Armillaria ostoyae]|uniref:Uncharacterized protein n=1 Tax=Armillaria ostoyae TaxID=47428 RepID=A0A284RWS5_ARMOS|nr:uncharacterized protein ARMOST_16647 [Armillaria ostoyae]
MNELQPVLKSHENDQEWRLTLRTMGKTKTRRNQTAITIARALMMKQGNRDQLRPGSTRAKAQGDPINWDEEYWIGDKYRMR